MFTLDIRALNQLCLDIAQSKQFYFNESTDYFLDLYHTGCRSTELLKPERWELAGSYFHLTTIKTEAPRTIQRDRLSSNFQDAITGHYKPYSNLTYDQLTLELRKVSPIHPVMAGKRTADTYLFRYNHARQLYAGGMSLPELMQYFGWLSGDVALSYLHTPLTFYGMKG